MFANKSNEPQIRVNVLTTYFPKPPTKKMLCVRGQSWAELSNAFTASKRTHIRVKSRPEGLQVMRFTSSTMIAKHSFTDFMGTVGVIG